LTTSRAKPSTMLKSVASITANVEEVTLRFMGVRVLTTRGF
jgi:hypothetical protein